MGNRSSLRKSCKLSESKALLDDPDRQLLLDCDSYCSQETPSTTAFSSDDGQLTTVLITKPIVSMRVKLMFRFKVLLHQTKRLCCSFQSAHKQEEVIHSRRSYAMRKRQLALLGILILMGWISIQLYLFVNKPQNQRLKHWIGIGYSDLVNNTNVIDQNVASQAHAHQLQNKSANGTLPDFNLPVVASQVARIEHVLSDQLKLNDRMIRTFKTISRLAREENKSIAEVIAEGRYLEVLAKADYLKDPVIAVLLFACNRVTVRRNLDQLIKYRPSIKTFPIVVSQDCAHRETRRVIQSYGDQLQHFIQQPDQSDILLKGKKEKKFKGYYKIARHYGWALNYTFNVLNYDNILIVEDDLDIAPDFFEYFLALYPILKTDSSLYCISAWNDNGKDGLVEKDPYKLYRSDFFPGLGWMLTKELWLEFQNSWPKAYWDDWIREPEQRKNRACIRPEMSRTKTFGKKGVSNGMFFEKHLKFIKLNDVPVPFAKINLTYLLKENYDVEFIKQVYAARVVDLAEARNLWPITPRTPTQFFNSSRLPFEPEPNSLRIQYNNMAEFKKAAKLFGLMDDFKSGVPRSGYQGIVSFMHKGFRVYLAPSPLWSGYDITWK